MIIHKLKSLRSTFKYVSARFFSAAKNKEDNLSAVLYGINDLRLEQRPIPCPKDNQVLLQMESIGICGSDVHYLVEGRIGPFVVKDPMVIGHEASGTVVDIGKKVKHLKSGDRVAIEPQSTCRTCSYCKEGRYHLCPDVLFCATPPIDGNLSRYYVHDADFCFKIADHMSFDEGALIEPLSVGVHSCKQGNVKFGDIVLVMGAGPIGITAMMAAKAMGASMVLITDILDFRLEGAKKFGADCVYHIKDGVPVDEIVKGIKCAIGEAPHVTIECAGTEQSVQVSFKATRTGGVVVLSGMGKPDLNVPIFEIFREVDIKGVFRYNNDYPTAIQMVSSGKAKVAPLCTHHFKIEESVKAFETAKTREGNPLKIIIHPNPNWSNKC